METESYIQKQLSSIDHQCTIFVVAYRISSIKDSDVILVLNNGHIVEQGTHDELLAKNGYYATVFRHQYGEYEQYTKQESGKGNIMARNKYDIDEVMEDKFDINQLKRLFTYVRPYKGQLALALFLMLSSSALTMLFPTFIMKIMDEYIPAGNIHSIVQITS